MVACMSNPYGHHPDSRRSWFEGAGSKDSVRLQQLLGKEEREGEGEEGVHHRVWVERVERLEVERRHGQGFIDPCV